MAFSHLKPNQYRESEETKTADIFLVIAVVLIAGWDVRAAPGDWPQPRHNSHLTAVQPLAGKMAEAPVPLARFDLGRSRPSITTVEIPESNKHSGLAIVSGGLRCYSTDGKLLWASHPAGLNYEQMVAAEDLDGDGKEEILLAAGRPTAPYGAAVLVSVEDGSLIWRYDVEPMSYYWYLFAGHYLPGLQSKQIIVLMQGYYPDKDNGYIALFEYPAAGSAPRQKWRYDFHEYTCYPSLLQSDLDGDGTEELVVETHSRMWFLDVATGAVKHFAKWDVSPANMRSYGLVRFVDLNFDGRDDFLCIGDFAQHHEVLLNRNGKMEKAWHYGWDESVTTGKVVTVYPDPPYADMDGDGGYEVVVSMFNSEGNGSWLTRVYDAVTGRMKYRASDMIAAAVRDADSDGIAEVLANKSHDHTRTVLEGAYVLKVKKDHLVTLWDDCAGEFVATGSGVPRLNRGNETFALEWSAEKGTYELAERVSPVQEPTVDFSAVPASQGPAVAELLAADLTGDGRNEIVLYQTPRATVLRLADSQLEEVASYESSCTPVIVDLDGDGRAELVTAEVRSDCEPVVTAVTPSMKKRVYWRSKFSPAERAGLPQPRRAYMRSGRFTGKETPDLYVFAGTPLVRSVVLDGPTGQLVWEKGEIPNSERYWAPTVDLASVYDFDADANEDLVFTNPDYYCVASGDTGELLLGPLHPPQIFKQNSQGLYTVPVILENKHGAPTVCLVSGHYFQGIMSLRAEPHWYELAEVGEHSPVRKGFIQLEDGSWLMGYGRQNGSFACVNMSDGTVRWEHPILSSASDVITCDVDGDGRYEFVFGTSHGHLYAIGDGGDVPRLVWRTDLSASVGPPIAADVNGDGFSEIITSTRDGYVYVLGSAVPN